jgi:acyl-CoA thioester hydrolase
MTMAERWPDLAGRIEQGRHVLPVRVYYEDTDFSGAVYHANYLRFCERGRSDLLRLTGVLHGELRTPGSDEPLSFAVRHMEIDFLKPARMDDALEVETRIAALSGAALSLDQRVTRQGEILFTAQVKVVVMDRRGRPRRLPAEVKTRLGAYLDPPRG